MKALTEALEEARKHEAVIKQVMGESAGLSQIDLDEATFHRADVELRLLREQAQPR